MKNHDRCEHIFGVIIGTNTTMFRIKKYWFRKCFVCRSRKMFSSMVRCIECKKLVHKNCMSWEKYNERDTQIVQCCQVVDTVDIVSDSEVEIIPSLVDVALTSDLIVNDSCPSMKADTITEATEDDRDQNDKDHEVTPMVLVKTDSAIAVTGQYNEPSTIEVENITEITRHTEQIKITPLNTDSEVIAEADNTCIYEIALPVTDMDAATVVADVINLAPAVVLQNYGVISVNNMVRNSANAVFLQDDKEIPTAVVKHTSPAIDFLKQGDFSVHFKETNTIVIPRINKDSKITVLSTDSEVTEKMNEARINEHAVIEVDAASIMAVFENDSAIACAGQNEGYTIIEGTEKIETPMHSEENEATESPTNSEAVKPCETTNMQTESEVTVKMNMPSINGNEINITDVNAATIAANVINLAPAGLLQNSGAIYTNVVVRDSANAIFLRDDQEIPTAIVEKYSVVVSPRQDKERMNIEDVEEIKTPMHIEGAEAIESPKNPETIEPSEIVEMYIDSEVTTKINVASINVNAISVTNVDVFTIVTNEKCLTSGFVSENHGAVTAVIPMKDSVNADLLQQDIAIPTAVVERDSASASPLKCDGPFTESNSSSANTTKAMSENNDEKIIPTVLSIIPINQAQMNQEIFCSPITPDQNTQLIELEKYDFEELDRNLSDKEKITFSINNLLAENVQVKCHEVNEILRQEHVRWFSGYLIEERVCYEFNQHELYSELLDRMGNEDLNALVLLKTADEIQKLLINDMRNHKTALNNLGHWLGIITLAKNKPIPFHNSFLKSLLLRPYMKKDYQRLTFIIPFVSKIMLSCAKSEDFGLNSSWTISLLRTLEEIHKLPDLKLNLQFEIEILYKSLNIELGVSYNE